MISSRRLAQMARKWMRAAAAGRKRIVFPYHTKGATTTLDSDGCSTAAPARKGHFVVYSNDRQRFEVPLAFLKSGLFRELLKMSENLSGLPMDGPITLPWDATFVGSAVSYLRRGRDAEGAAVLVSMAAHSCSPSLGSSCSLVNQPAAVFTC